jgi:hypothetical protein
VSTEQRQVTPVGHAPLCIHGYRVARGPWPADDPTRCACCGNVPLCDASRRLPWSDTCGCADAGECVHCGKFLPAGTWRAGDYGPACVRCLARSAELAEQAARLAEAPDEP